jgi:pyruvate/2-oxoglutarate dehydrogenase complex dihydrolipoamide dehydrogenase (E3) component
MGHLMTTIELLPDDEFNRELVAQARPADWRNPEVNGRYNLLVIGGGSAGLVCAAGAAGVGAKVALVEKHLLGGDCLNSGCVPSKTIIRSAKLIGDVARAADFGVHIPDGLTTDFAAVMGRMRQVRAAISHHDSAQRFTDLGIDVFLGEGAFTGPNQFAIGGQTIEFKKAVIATGSRPAILPIPGLAETGFLTNEDVFYRLVEQPRRLAVIGGGPIGVELAQTMQRLGSQVSLFDVADHILPREEPDAAAVVQAQLVRDGVQLYLAANIGHVSQAAAGKRLSFTLGGVEQTLEVDEILLAVGRRPNVEGLNLEAAGVAYSKTGVTVNDRLQTSNPAIYAAGDVALKYQFTHAADAAARIVVQNALFLGRKKFSDVVVPWVTYSDPELAHVGLYPQEAAEQGLAIDSFTTQFADTDRGRADGVTAGFVRIHVRKGTDKIVGATIVGPHAGEMIGEITLALANGLGLSRIAQTVHPYPTLAEAIRKTADAWNRTRLTPVVAGLFDRWLRWTR